MFWDKYVALCVQHGESPNSVARSLSISSGSVTKWKNGAVPRAGTLKRIADYFGVDVGELVDVYIHLPKFDLQMFSAPEKKGEEKEKSAINDATPHISLTPEEQLVIMRYRSVNPDTRAVIRKILDVPGGGEELIPVYHAARSKDGSVEDTIIYRTREEVERLENAPESDDDI